MLANRYVLCGLLIGAFGCNSGTTPGEPSDPGTPPPPPPAPPQEISAVVFGNVTVPSDGSVSWFVSARAFGPDCVSPLGLPVGSPDVYGETTRSGYRAVVRLNNSQPANGCIEVSFSTSRVSGQVRLPSEISVFTTPARFIVNGDRTASAEYRVDLVAE